jgi:hypothetical protein
MQNQIGRAYLILPRVPLGKEKRCWDGLRQELVRYNLKLTILGLTPEGRPSVKLLGPRASLRRYLDERLWDCVGITSGE